MHVFLAEHVQVTALLALSQRETDSSLSMLILAFLAEHAQVLALLEQSQKSNKVIKPAAYAAGFFHLYTLRRTLMGAISHSYNLINQSL